MDLISRNLVGEKKLVHPKCEIIMVNIAITAFLLLLIKVTLLRFLSLFAIALLSENDFLCRDKCRKNFNIGTKLKDKAKRKG